jgi:glycine/D-amino acid oxidase-like deaminating enzyme
MSRRYDTIIIGGGFYGLRLAQFLKEDLGQSSVLVIEKEPDVMQRASYNNQARVHNGYHYPRSVLTALRSRVNLPIFSQEYEQAIVRDFTKYYAIATSFSKVSANQFLRFYERIGAKIEPSKIGMDFFDRRLIEQVFEVEEYAFNTKILKDLLLRKLSELRVDINVGESVDSIWQGEGGITVQTDKNSYLGTHVLNTTYSSINNVNNRSGLPSIPLKHELTEMCLVDVPKEFSTAAFTIMCGPFFSLMPFPDKNKFSLSHVRYTPHSEWHDTPDHVRDSHQYLNDIERVSHFPQMIADVKRYMPAAKHVTYSGESLWEVKTVLPQSEADDSRPILYKDHYGGVANYICIMGGKIDNIYDVFRELKITYGK